ncbi:MAG: outer membrane lipoprotein carrier protein LolA [Pseudoalteromonas spongiae]
MRSALLVCIAFAAFFANANTTLVDAFSELKLVNQSKVSGQFEQHKKIKVLKNSIVSAGSFSADQSGFVWQQKTPIASTIRMDEQGIYSKDHRGNESQMTNADLYIPLLQALLLQDPVKLSDYLQVHSVADNCINLSANEPLDQVFSAVKLCGTGTISRIVLSEQAGHTTEINLTYAAAN